VRTTLTLDDDVARMVEEEVRQSGETFKGVVNALIRDGVVARRNPQKRKRFVVKPFALGTGLGTRFRNVNELIEALEGPAHK